MVVIGWSYCRREIYTLCKSGTVVGSDCDDLKQGIENLYDYFIVYTSIL